MTHFATPDTDTRPRVLFIGRDSSSPQIAASLLSQVADDRVRIETAGTRPAEPGGRSDEMLVAMGLNPADEHRVSVHTLNRADRVVSLASGLDVARVGGARYEEWDLAHEDLVDHVEALSRDLLNPPTVEPKRTVLTRVRSWLVSWRPIRSPLTSRRRSHQ